MKYGQSARYGRVPALRLYRHYFSIHLRTQMEYGFSFLLTFVGQTAASCMTLLSLYFLFARFSLLEGFTFEEVLLCFGVVLAVYTVAMTIFRGLDTFSLLISNGEFDRMLLRPRDPIFQVVSDKVDFSRAGRLLQAAAVFAYAVTASGVHWTADKILTLALMLLCGMVFFASLFLLDAAVSFFTIEGLEFMNILTYGSSEFGSYPLSIYGRRVLKFLTYVIPMACFQYYPLLYLTGQTENRLYMLLPLCSLLFALPCYGLWRLGLRRFHSTGS